MILLGGGKLMEDKKIKKYLRKGIEILKHYQPLTDYEEGYKKGYSDAFKDALDDLFMEVKNGK